MPYLPRFAGAPQSAVRSYAGPKVGVKSFLTGASRDGGQAGG